MSANALVSTVEKKPVILSGMNVHLIAFGMPISAAIALHGQTQPSASVPFAGCYEVISQNWHPGNEDVSPIPSRFELRDEQTDKLSTGIFQMRGIPAGRSDWERLWRWRPEGDGRIEDPLGGAGPKPAERSRGDRRRRPEQPVVRASCRQGSTYGSGPFTSVCEILEGRPRMSVISVTSRFNRGTIKFHG